MNVKLVFADRVESWDTRADGSATTSHASIEIRGAELVLWSALDFDDEYTVGGEPKKARKEHGTPKPVLTIDSTSTATLPEFLAEAGREHGLLRFDIDGETIWEAEAPDAGGE